MRLLRHPVSSELSPTCYWRLPGAQKPAHAHVPDVSDGELACLSSVDSNHRLLIFPDTARFSTLSSAVSALSSAVNTWSDSVLLQPCNSSPRCSDSSTDTAYV